MKCPVCNDINLRLAERQGVEIDYCPQCRGIWLDRGELDKIIERSSQVEHSARSQPRTSNSHEENEPERRTSRHSDYHEDRHEKAKKKRGFLDDLFDFD